eukprot:TRINITY_DN14446_c0_g1_i1.p1 TRINITY_DN14446_c0_g1~~TRINITY_DN14446_c0_g1_i1.p1  ORF type:complete len:539 (-),score=75.92 TRINITY_DN14446_c0_g1_i1:43-1659(-)
MIDNSDLYNSDIEFFFFQAEDGIRDAQESRGLGDVYKRQAMVMDGRDAELDGINAPQRDRFTWESYSFLLAAPLLCVLHEYHQSGGLANLIAELFWSRPWTRPMSILLLVLWGWVANSFVFSRSGINTSALFGHQADLVEGLEGAVVITWAYLTLHTAPVFGVLNHFTYMGVGLTDVWHHVLLIVLFGVGVALLAGPGKIHQIYRPFKLPELVRILVDILTTPVAGPVTFVHVLIADYLTSLAKTFSDMYITTCTLFRSPLFSEYPNEVAAHELHIVQSQCTHSLIVPFVILIPTLCRVMQCWKVYRSTRDANNLVNLVKYLSTVPVVLISILKKLSPELWPYLAPAWGLSVVVNSCYTCCWDIVMDWGLVEVVPGADETLAWWKKPRQFRTVRRYPIVVYYAIMSLNLILRFMWSLKLVDFSLPVTADSTIHVRLSILDNDAARVFLFSALEVLRRNCWTVLRVEWEEVKQLPSTPEANQLLELEVCNDDTELSSTQCWHRGLEARTPSASPALTAKVAEPGAIPPNHQFLVHDHET